MVKCPNKNHPEWKELERLLPNQAYVVWDAFPYGIDKAPNGADSKLFRDLLEHYNGDRDSAIRAKAKTATDAFKTWFGGSKVVDENGEPLIVWHGSHSDFSEFSKEKLGTFTGVSSAKLGFFFTDNKKMSKYYTGEYSIQQSYNDEEYDGGNYESLKNENDDQLLELHEMYMKASEVIDNNENYDELTIKWAKDIMSSYEDDVEAIKDDYKIQIKESYGTHYYPSFLSISNPEIRDDKGKKFDAGSYTGQLTSAIAKGNDGAFRLNTNDPLNANIYVAFDPNQIKSIDNVGDFSTSANIYYKLMNDVQEAKSELYDERKKKPINNELKEEFKRFDNTSDLIKYALDKGLVPNKLVHIAEAMLKHSTTLQFKEKGSGEQMAGYFREDNRVEMYDNAFRVNPQEVVETLLHEVMHYYIDGLYEHNDVYARDIDRFYKKYLSLCTDEEIGKHYGLYEGTSIEFINELLTNTEFREFLKTKSEPKWKQLLRRIASALRIDTASAMSVDDIVEGITELLDDVAKQRKTYGKYYTEKYSKEQDTTVIRKSFSKEDSVFMNNMKKESVKLRQKIKGGLESRIKALQQYGKITANRVMLLQQEIDRLEDMYEKNDDKLALIEFIKHTSLEAQRPVDVVTRAHEELRETGKFSLRNDQLVQLQKDFIGFYEPIIEDINLKLRIIGYFDDMSDTEKAFIDNEMSAITNNFAVIKAKYSNLLSTRFAELLLKYGNAYDSNTIKTYVDDNVNSTNTDIGFFATYIGGMKNSKDEALNLIARRVADTQNGIERTTVKKASELLPIFKRVNDWQQFYEVDENGKKTGYLVRDKNYGQYYKERDAYFNSLGEAPTTDKVALKEWYSKRNKWLSEHTERRYKPEYYDLFDSMSFASREARDKIQLEISIVLADYTDRSGDLHLENMPDAVWTKLQNLYEQKRLLSNHYNSDGSRKSGIDEEIADDLSRINKVLSEELSYRSNIDKFNKVAEKKKAELTPEQYAKWYDRSTRIAYTEEFQKELKKLERRYYNEDYAMLSEERRELTGMYRNLHDFAINTIKMPQTVKDRIKALDIQMTAIASTYPKGRSEFTRLAHIESSQYYMQEKSAAIARDQVVPGFYRQWSINSHYTDSRGVRVPYSYFNLMLPNNTSNVVIAPSGEYSEADPTSNYWNNNFDDNDKENVQPKRSLYDNQKNYDKVAGNTDAKAMYDAIVDTMSESNDKMQFMKYKNNYKLPQISGSMWAYIKSSDAVIKGVGEYFKDAAMVRQDDIDYNYDSIAKNTAPDGRKLATIPVHYVRMLDKPSAITNNLGGAVIKYFEMAENYVQKQAMLPELELMQEQIDSRSYDPITTHDKLDKLRRFNNGKGQTNASKRLAKYYDVNVYGQNYTPITIGKFNATKILTHIKSYMTLVNLGASLFVATTNFAGALHQHTIEALAGAFYTPRASLIAFKEFVHYLGNTVWNWGDYTHSNKMLSAMNFNQISRETSNIYDKLNYNRLARFVSNHGWYGMITAGDFIVKSQIMMSVYLSTKYVPGEGFTSRYDYSNKYGKDQTKEVYDNLGTPTLWDIYEQDGTTLKVKDKYENFKQYLTPEFTNKIINTVQYLAQRADGMLDSAEKNTAQTNALLGFIVMHKSYLFNAIEDRIIKPKAYNYMTGRMDEAMYKTAATRLYELLKYIRDLRKYKRLDPVDRVDKPKLRKLEDYQKYNIKRVGIELSLVIAYNLISMLLNSWDEDEDTWISNFIAYLHARPTYEAGNLFNPWDVFNSFKTLSPANATLENFKTLLGVVWIPGWDDLFNGSTKYGPYEGMSAFEKASFKVTPLKNIIEVTDPKQKHKYLKGQLQ